MPVRKLFGRRHSYHQKQSILIHREPAIQQPIQKSTFYLDCCRRCRKLFSVLLRNSTQLFSTGGGRWLLIVCEQASCTGIFARLLYTDNLMIFQNWLIILNDETHTFHRIYNMFNVIRNVSRTTSSFEWSYIKYSAFRSIVRILLTFVVAVRLIHVCLVTEAATRFQEVGQAVHTMHHTISDHPTVMDGRTSN